MKRLSVLVAALMCASIASADEIRVSMDRVSAEGIEGSMGTVTIKETEYGLVFIPELEGLTPGQMHGFHVHENPSCEPAESNGEMRAAMAAGGHYDPEGTERHGTPWGDGHLGDLPALHVDEDGRAGYPVLAPRLSLDDVRGRALMVHEGADTHSDSPEPLGGGGARIGCGVIDGS